MRVTLPAGVVESDPLEVFVESQGPERDLLIATGDEMVPLKNGTVLHPPTGRGKRKDFFIITAAGEMVCAWKPSIGFAPLTPVAVSKASERARQIASRIVVYPVAGDPIFIERPRSLNKTETFTIGDLAATVLARSERMVILRDPGPKPGWRTIEWNGGSLNLRFAEVLFESTKRSHEPPSLNVAAHGLEGIIRSRSVVMYVTNHSKLQGRLRCGRRVRGAETDREEARSFTIFPEMIENGSFQTNCPVDWVDRNKGPMSLDASFFEFRL